MRLFIILLMTLLLAACSKGGTQQSVIGGDGSAGMLPSQRSLIFAYPTPGQTEVIPSGPVILRFSHPLLVATPASALQHFSITNVQSNEVVPFVALVTDDGRSVTLTPTQALRENTTYQVKADVIELVPGSVTLPDIRFTTRAGIEGPRLSQSVANNTTFQVVSQLPDPTNYPIVDFSTLRLQFSQPVDPNTVVYGASVRLREVTQSAGVTTVGTQDVPARILVSGNHISIDPEDTINSDGLLLTSKLVAGKRYVLQLSSAIKSRFGDSLVPGNYANYSFTPLATGPNANMAAEVANANGVKSILTGTVFNRVPVVSNLLGNQTAAEAQGLLGIDLADTQKFPNAVPVRLRRGSLLSGTGLDVKIDGVVPANLNTGKLTVNIISDANGTLIPNPYSTSPFAPRQVNLQLDVAVSAEQNSSNGAFTQNILHVNTVGISIVKNGRLIIDAVGVVELKVLGVDNASGVLALHIEGFENQLTAPRAGADAVPPSVQSRVPNVGGDAVVRPGDPILVNFTEVLDIKTIMAADAVTLTQQNEGTSTPQTVAFTRVLDGVSLVIQPTQPLAYGAQYQVSLGSGATLITDIAGNALTPTTFTFTVPRLVNKVATDALVRPPVLLAIYPGFPCPINPVTRNVANNIQGQCLGGKSTDDLLPLPVIESGRDIFTVFSQSIDPASLRLATTCSGVGSVRVELLNAAGVCQSIVPGRLLKANPRELLFKPDNPWQNNQLYHVVLNSNASNTSAIAVCDGSQAVCGSNGLPLKTQLIAQTLAEVSTVNRGGPAIDVLFRGGPMIKSTPVGLRLLPNYDVDANFIYQQPVRGYVGAQAERAPDVDAAGNVFAPNAVRIRPDRTQRNYDINKPPQGQFTKPAGSGAATDLAVGCPFSQRDAESDINGYESGAGQCARAEQLIATSALAATLGSFDPALGGIKVQINPGLVMASEAYLYGKLGITIDATTGATLGGITSLTPGPLKDLLNSILLGVVPAQLVTLPQPIPTGPLVLRIRYKAGQLVTGVLKAGTNGGNPILSTTLDLYLDIPEVDAKAYIGSSPPGAGIPLQLDHNARSLELSNIKVTGQTNFLPDGRLAVTLKNDVPIYITANIFDRIVPGLPLVSGTIYAIAIPGDFTLNATLAPLKK